MAVYMCAGCGRPRTDDDHGYVTIEGPRYDAICEDCAGDYEAHGFQSCGQHFWREDDPPVCPVCHKPAEELEEAALASVRAEWPAMDDRVAQSYDALEGLEDLQQYHARHGTPSLLILTQHSPEIAFHMALMLAPRIAGKRIVEIGAGVGYLAFELAKHAASVVAIEVDPAWSWCFVRGLYRHKPANLTWIFGTAESVADIIRADVAIICTRSGVPDMRTVALRMAPEVIMPFQDDESAFPAHQEL